jgi:hypothetical protein
MAQRGLTIIDNMVILYKTKVLKIEGENFVINNGGWVTASTAKAINTGFDTFGMDLKVKRKAGRMFLVSPRGHEIELDNDQDQTFRRTL